MNSGGKRVRPDFNHLAALTDERGLFARARGAAPRPEDGYRLDDAAGGLVVTCREPRPSTAVARLHDRYLEFVLAAVGANGTCHARMGPDRGWRDEPGVGDGWGRAVWGLGVAAGRSPGAGQRARALAGFRVVAQQRSPDRRAMAFAALGAGAALRARPSEPAAEALLREAVGVIDAAPAGPGWPWPEARLGYANAALAEALIVAGDALTDRAVRTRGLRLLAFLLGVEIRDKHLSVTPPSGRGPRDVGPAFDQRPIEVASIADACATAYRVTTDPRWLTGINLAWRWFLGGNDARAPMLDPVTGGGFDCLHADGPGRDQGAEATLAVLSTAQHARDVQGLR